MVSTEDRKMMSVCELASSCALYVVARHVPYGSFISGIGDEILGVASWRTGDSTAALAPSRVARGANAKATKIKDMFVFGPPGTDTAHFRCLLR